MTAPDLVNLSALIDDAECFALVRQQRWPEGVRCPACSGATVVRDGLDETQVHRQHHRCKACAGRFDDLTGTALAGHRQPLRVWVLCLYFMGPHLSNRQIAQEPGLDGSDAQAMTERLRRGWSPRLHPCGWRERSRSTRSTSWPGRHRQVVGSWVSEFASRGRCWHGVQAAAATPLMSAHISNARALAARYSLAVTERVPLHEQAADMAALGAADLGAAVGVGGAAPGASPS